MKGQHENTNTIETTMFEKHYSAKEIAEQWNLHVDTVRKIFDKESGVLRMGNPESRHKRGYKTIRVPESVMLRVYRRMTTT